MKKILLAVLALALAVCCFATVFTATAATDVAVSNTPSGRGYFKYAPFEDFEEGISGASVVYAANTHAWATDEDGNHALSTTQGDNGYAGQMFSMGTSSEIGTYFVEFDIKPVKNVVAATVLFGIPASGTHFAQIGLSFNSDLSNLTVVDGVTVGGWSGITNYKNASVSKLDNGYWHVYFEYDVTADMSSATSLVFCQNATVGGDNSAQWDNIAYGNLAKSADYYNIDWDVDYGKLTNVWSEQPIWANSGDVVSNYFGTGVSALKINATDTNNTQIGGIVNTAGNPIKIAKEAVMTYYQFDIDLDGLSMLNIWTSGCYTAVIYQNGVWHVEGGAINLKAVRLAKGWRISYFIDMGAANAANMEFNINTTGTGAAYIANLLVAQIDTVRAPWVSSETVTYNASNPADVNVTLDVKGKAITALTCGGDAVDAANYSYSGEKLTLKAAAFSGKTGDLDFTLATESGSVDFTVISAQTKIPLTVALKSTAAINKYYDETTDVKEEIEFDVTGIEADHDVRIIYTAKYDSAAAGTGRKITITFELAGNDAALYELATEMLEITGCEIYDRITVTLGYEGEPIVKYENGNTDVSKNDIVLTLNGVAQGDDVNVTFDAAYESAAAGKVKINITNAALSGADAGKYKLASATLQIDGEILARTTTTATYAGEIEKRYDGTSFLNTKGMTLTLSNIADGDQVSVTFKAEFIGKEVGDRTVRFTNLVLTGRDAYKYVLAATSFEKVGYIIEMKDVSVSDNAGFYTMDGQTLQYFDFENVITGNVVADAISGLYLSPSSGEMNNGITQTASVVEEDGNKVLKLEENCFGYATQLFSTNATGSYRDAGIYAVSFKVKPQNASIIGVLIRNSYATNDAESILADYRYSVTNDASGKAISVAKETQGFLGENQRYFNGRATVDANGWIDCYFEYELAEGITYADKFCPVLIFTGATASSKTISTYYFDDVSYLCKSTPDKYMTIDHNFDMEGANGDAVTDTPFYSDLGEGFVYDNEWTGEFVADNTVVRLDIPANTSAQRVGCFKNSIADGNDKLFKGDGIHYVQFDFDMTCSHFKLYSHGDAGSFNFFAISCDMNGDQYSFSVECYDGWISNFKTQVTENGMTRVSFIADMSGSAFDATYLNLEASAGSAGGSIYFDNLFVSHEDYTPSAKDATYNFVGTDDVVFNVYLKGAKLESVELDNVAVSADKYVYDAAKDTITLDKSLFATTNPQVAARVLKVKTSEGDLTAKAKLVDNRKEVTLSLDYTGAAIAKDYDGTTDVDQAVIDAIVEQIAIGGVTAGDDISFTCDVAYSSKNAGTTTIEITNIRLTGANADDYKLATESLTVEAEINKIQLTVSGTTAANKTYDGTTNAVATAGTLTGVLNGETVTLSVATAVFNSANVADANKVSVTYALSGADAANYIAPVAEDIANATIGKKTVTVKADAKTITVGDVEPALTYTTEGLVAGDALTGTLTREQGAEEGEYAILQGTLSAGDNYTINFVSAKLTIAPAQADPAGLSTGAIVGIVVGVAAVAGAAALAVVLVLKKRRSK
ncbi:MAG: YDG domain-containing protein [Corallococcus sp.]|nr:YDG domain-containing protein [Corallococcus sp.]MCM1359822.1 YDG domain-containing protein [Corallococcus sp.]MCM1395256.1 YDG domain-containing protein [Corallococcus sp.]